MANLKTVEIEDANGNKLKGFIDTNGVRISDFGKPPEETANIIDDIQNLPVKDDDVLLWSVVKAGNHWVFEIMYMLINEKIKSTEPHQIDYTFLEMLPQCEIEAVPSPRKLNSHLPFRLLPKQMKDIMADYRLVEVKDLGGESVQNMMDIDGLRLTTFMQPPEVTANIVHNIKNMELRDDDVMFCSAVKSGTHWGFEIIAMLLNGKADTISLHKEYTMLEARSQANMEAIPSPRILNSHLTLSLLPKQLKDKKTKIVLILRNPKDMSVSYYHHHKGVNFYGYNGKFKDYLPVLLDGELDYGSWFDYIREWEKDMNSGDYDIHLLYFEDLKENGVEEIKKIARFLGVPDNNELCEAICEKCHFDKMVAAKVYPEGMKEMLFKDNFSMYRKGQIGDWKNYYTVAMSEEFDKLYDEKLKDSKLTFRYSPSLS